MSTVIVPLILNHSPGDPSPTANLRDGGWDVREGEWAMGPLLVGERRVDGSLVSLFLGDMGQAVIMASGGTTPTRRAVMGVYRMYSGQQDPGWPAVSEQDFIDIATEAEPPSTTAGTELACAAFLARCARLLRMGRVALVKRGLTPTSAADFVIDGLPLAGWLECVDWMGRNQGIPGLDAIDAERSAFARIAAYTAASPCTSPLRAAASTVADAAFGRLAGGA